MSSDDLPERPKWLPYAVISIWLFLGLVVVIVILSGDPNSRRTIELVAQVIAVLGGAAAAIAGFLAVKAANDTLRQAREDRQAELELKRPRFAPSNGQMALQYTETRENADYITLQFENYGGHPAGDVKSQVFGFVEQQTPELVLQQTEANDVAVGRTFLFYKRGINIQHNDSTYFLCFRLEFIDRVTGKAYEESFYYKWRTVPGFGRNYFSGLSIEEKELVTNLVAEYEKTLPHAASESPA